MYRYPHKPEDGLDLSFVSPETGVTGSRELPDWGSRKSRSSIRTLSALDS